MNTSRANHWAMLIAATAVMTGRLPAQRVQNMDISIVGGPCWVSSQRLSGSDVVIDSQQGHSLQTGYGYQIQRTTAGSLWIEVNQLFVLPGLATANVPGSVNRDLVAVYPGVRFMVPLHPRFAVYGSAGAGYAWLHYPTIADPTKPLVTSKSTHHGAFVVGGGIDIRLGTRLSLRGEFRDVVTGRGLSGSTGRHHVIPLFGIATHF